MHFLFHWHQFMLTTLMINGECVYNWVGGIENHLHSLRLNLCKFSFCLKGETVRHAISNIKQFCASIQFVEETLLISSYGSRRQYSSTYFMSWFSTPYFAFVRNDRISENSSLLPVQSCNDCNVNQSPSATNSVEIQFDFQHKT